MKEIIDKYFEYVNKDDFDSLMNLWAEDGEFELPLTGTMKGKKNLRSFYEAVRSSNKKHADNPIDWIISGNKAAVKIHVEVTNNAGRVAAFDSVDWFTFENAKIKRMESYWDTVKMMKMLKG